MSLRDRVFRNKKTDLPNATVATTATHHKIDVKKNATVATVARGVEKNIYASCEHLGKYINYNERLDSLSTDVRNAFVSDFIGITGQYSNSILFHETHTISKGHTLSFTIAVWVGALCDLSPKQIINTLDDAITKHLFGVISSPFKFHDRCKRIHIE